MIFESNMIVIDSCNRLKDCWNLRKIVKSTARVKRWRLKLDLVAQSLTQPTRTATSLQRGFLVLILHLQIPDEIVCSELLMGHYFQTWNEPKCPSQTNNHQRRNGNLAQPSPTIKFLNLKSGFFTKNIFHPRIEMRLLLNWDFLMHR